MRGEQDKGEVEIAIFSRFIARSGLPIDAKSVEKRTPPEPDIACRMADGSGVAFELAELCDPDVARALNAPVDEEAVFFWAGDPSLRIARKKRSKEYQSAYPIELLCYKDGRIITPDDVAIPTLQMLNFSKSSFRRVWFMGSDCVELIYTAS